MMTREEGVVVSSFVVPSEFRLPEESKPFPSEDDVISEFKVLILGIYK
jgi:hypothetical protein